MNPAPGSSTQLAGHVALVTGGGWNIGRVVAIELARRGAKVAVAARRTALLTETVAAIRAAGGTGHAISADFLDLRAAERAAHETEGTLGPITVLVALAGGFGAGEPIDTVDPDAWWRTVETNVRTAFHAVRAVLPGMRARGGQIVLAAGGGAFDPMPGVHATAYASAKAALCRLTDQLQVELLDTRIHVNCIEPGAVWPEEEMARVVAEEKRTGQPHPIRAHLRDPRESAELIAWLLTEAAGHVRGRLISVRDGWWRDRAQAEKVVASDFYRLRRRT